jgi:hypothetical protein
MTAKNDDAFAQRQNLILPPHLQTSKIDMLRVSPAVAAFAIAIAKRANERATEAGTPIDWFVIAVDIAVVHTHGRPLDLQKMYSGDIGDCLLDCLDITMQINRYDGQLPASLKLRNQLSLN